VQVSYINVTNKPTWSGKQQLSHKITTTQYTYFLLKSKISDSTYLATLKVIGKVVTQYHQCILYL
jgi:disulfide oxidoreductase YuzD